MNNQDFKVTLNILINHCGHINLPTNSYDRITMRLITCSKERLSFIIDLFVDREIEYVVFGCNILVRFSDYDNLVSTPF